MPLPLGHAVVGYSVAAATGVRFRRNAWTAVLFSLVVANLPDADFLPGALADEPGIYHRTIAHTLPAALLGGLIIGAVLTRFGGRFWEITVLGTLVYSSHLFADMVNFGGGNIGVQILWPFDHGWYNIPTPWADSDGGRLVFERGADSEGFFAAFATWQFVRALLLQALLFSPLLPIGWLIRWKRSAASR